MEDEGQEGPQGSLLGDGSDRQSMLAFLCGGGTLNCILDTAGLGGMHSSPSLQSHCPSAWAPAPAIKGPR